MLQSCEESPRSPDARLVSAGSRDRSKDRSGVPNGCQAKGVNLRGRDVRFSIPIVNRMFCRRTGRVLVGVASGGMIAKFRTRNRTRGDE